MRQCAAYMLFDFFPCILWVAYWVPCSASTDYVSPTDSYPNASGFFAETACALLARVQRYMTLTTPV